jgi:hypothetical protein
MKKQSYNFIIVVALFAQGDIPIKEKYDFLTDK